VGARGFLEDLWIGRTNESFVDQDPVMTSALGVTLEIALS